MSSNRTLGLTVQVSFGLTLLALMVPGAVKAQTVASTTGATTVLTSAPANVSESGLASNTKAFGFQEQQNVSLSQALGVDISQSGTYTTVASLTPGTIAAGTDVNSYMVYTNPAGTTAKTYSGSITFDQKIIGVIVVTGSLNNSDAQLGATGTTYPGQNGTPDTARGLEFNTDSVMVSFVGDTLSYHLSTNQYVDEIRIITAGSSVATPEPSSLVAFGLGALALGGIMLASRRKKTGLAAA